MSIALDRNPATLENAARPRPRRRWPWVVIGLIAATLGALMIGAWVWTGHYQPLTGGGLIVVQSRDVETQWKENTFGTEVVLLQPRGGQTASAQFQLWNEGDHAVTVESLGLDSWIPTTSHVGFLEATATRVRVDERFLKTEPFTPRELASGDYMTLTFTMTFADCDNPSGGSTGTTFVPVTYSAFGRTHTVDVPLGYGLTLENYQQCRVG